MSNSSNLSTVEEEIRDLEKTEEKLINVVEIVREVTELLSNTDIPTEERKEQSKLLTLKYLSTVDEICDTLRNQTELMKNYREVYRIDTLPWLKNTINQLNDKTVKADAAINLIPNRNK